MPHPNPDNVLRDFQMRIFARSLPNKGVNTFLAVEVSVEFCKKKYGQQYNMIINGVKQEDDLRVLDYKGFNVFYNFPFSTWGARNAGMNNNLP